MSKGKIISIDRKQKRIKVAVSIVAAIFLVVLYGMIFSFSEQDGETSGRLSHEVTKWIVERWERLAGLSWTEDIKNGWIEYWSNPVRKLAHFSEYTAMGILVFFTLNPWIKPGKKKNLLIILWVFISAALDEWHQTFIADRCGNFLDVLLDTSGGCFGLMLCLLCFRIFEGIRRKKGAV